MKKYFQSHDSILSVLKMCLDTVKNRDDSKDNQGNRFSHSQLLYTITQLIVSKYLSEEETSKLKDFQFQMLGKI